MLAYNFFDLLALSSNFIFSLGYHFLIFDEMAYQGWGMVGVEWSFSARRSVLNGLELLDMVIIKSRLILVGFIIVYKHAKDDVLPSREV